MIQINQRMSGLKEFINPTDVALRIDKSNGNIRIMHAEDLIGLCADDEHVYDGIILQGEYGHFLKPLRCHAYSQQQLIKGKADSKVLYMVSWYTPQQRELTHVDGHVFLWHSFMKGGNLELYGAIKDKQLIQIFQWSSLVMKLMCRFANTIGLRYKLEHEAYR